MAVHYHSFDGELVSDDWFAFLSSARAAGVHFWVNEGHRTFSRQAWFYNCYITKRCNNGNLAAKPSPNAPHIRTGRQDHAIDSDQLQELIDYGRNVGVSIRRTVTGEPWHGEASAGQLAAFARRYRPAVKYPHLTKWERKQVGKLFYHRKKMRQHPTGAQFGKALRWARWYKRKLKARIALLSRLHSTQNRQKRLTLLRAIVTDGKRIS